MGGGGRQVRLIIKIDRIAGGGKFHGRKKKSRTREEREREREKEAGHLYRQMYQRKHL